MPLVTSSATFSWLNHDSWSEAYVGTRKLAYELLPSTQSSVKAVDGALCQLALIGANHLMEIALYKILQPHANATGTVSSLTEKKLADASYNLMLTKWLPDIAGNETNLTIEPLLSTERLRHRRNATAHKSSALATVEMARSALFSAVQGSYALFALSGTKFPYEPFMQKYPLHDEPWFSSIKFPGQL
jgi:hypothetical protein